VRIIEYSDLPAEAGERRAADGSLDLWAGNTAIHVFDLAFLERVKADQAALPFHLARKAVPHVDEKGMLVEPKEPNALKFERFIFDLLPAARNAIVMEVDPAQAFAPLKNAPGSATDSPESVQRAIVALHGGWLRTVGVEIADGVPVEISPLFALDAFEAARKAPRHTSIAEPTYFS
jgi:UDP-N-acetylglucosamine/UDP-N-acetylgalactosamine diphosphorylase